MKNIRLTTLSRGIIYPALTAAGLYLLVSYMLIPGYWSHYEHHPSLSQLQKTATTREGLAADPVNIFVAAEPAELCSAMAHAGWQPADKISLKSSVKTALMTLLDGNYPTAPVSDLFYLGRKEDYSFEISDGRGVRSRHHVRFWRTGKSDRYGRPLWAGAAAFDNGIELSSLTGKVTHRISPDIDAERDFLAGTLLASGLVERYYQVTGIGPVITGRNGGGDSYFTDGEASVLTLKYRPGPALRPEMLHSPAMIETKNSVFRSFKPLLKRLNNG